MLKGESKGQLIKMNQLFLYLLDVSFRRLWKTTFYASFVSIGNLCYVGKL